MRTRTALAVAGVALCGFGADTAFAANPPAPPGSQGTPPPATPKGCHGFWTVAYKQATGDPSQAQGITGIIAQTQSEEGRGGTLQDFLAINCGLGSEAHP
jgi:hypothetical protein